MVAISLYRGNLHRVPDTPRRWPLPAPSISVSQFRLLLKRRHLAVSRLLFKPKPVPSSVNNNNSSTAVKIETPVSGVVVKFQDEEQKEEGEIVDADPGLDPELKREEEDDREEGEVNDVVVPHADSGAGLDPNSCKLELSDSKNAATENQEEKREVEKKLEALNEKKHNLVLMLKHILNTEEEIRRRNMQSMMRASMPIQSENTGDGIGSYASRQAPRMTVEVNFGNDAAGESDAGSNQGTPGRQLHHISPSAASFARSPFSSLQHNSVHTPRSPAAFSTASPSRLAMTGHQGHGPSIPPVSLPGYGFVASSPSSAASGGSSVFRDHRPPSST